MRYCQKTVEILRGEAALQANPEQGTMRGAAPLVDILHRACLLWEKDRQDELSALVAARGGELWPVAPAMVELLPRDNAERKALESMLGTRLDLESRAQRWAEEHQPQPKLVQGRLWEEETDGQ